MITDWTPVLGGIAALLTAIGGVWAIIAAASRQKETGQDTRTERTLDGAWELIDKLREEREHCDERINKLEAEVKTLKDTVKTLEVELRQAYKLGGNRP